MSFVEVAIFVHKGIAKPKVISSFVQVIQTFQTRTGQMPILIKIFGS